MNVSQRDVNGITVLDVTDEVDLYHAFMLKELFDQCISERKLRIVVNMKNVSFVDSSGLGAIISGQRKLSDNHGHLKLVHVPNNVLSIFKLTNVDTYFDIHQNEEEAISAFS